MSRFTCCFSMFYFCFCSFFSSHLLFHFCYSLKHCSSFPLICLWNKFTVKYMNCIKACLGWNDLFEVKFLYHFSKICIVPLFCYAHGPPNKYQQLLYSTMNDCWQLFLTITGFEPYSLLCLWIVGVVTYVITDNFLNSEYARFLFSGACLHGFIWELIPFISGLTQYNSRV